MKFDVQFEGIQQYLAAYSKSVLRRIEKRLIMKLLAYVKTDTKEKVKGTLKRRTGTLLKSIGFKSLRGDAGMIRFRKKGFYGTFFEAGTKVRSAKKDALVFDAGDGYRRVKSVAAIAPRWMMRDAVNRALQGKYNTQQDAFLQSLLLEIDRKAK